MPNILNLSENDEEFNKNEKNIGLKFGLQISKPHFLFYNDQDDGSKENYEQEIKDSDSSTRINENLLLLDKIISDDIYDKEKFNYFDLIRNENLNFDTASENAKFDEDEEANLINRNSILNGLLESFSSEASLPTKSKNTEKITIFDKIDKSFSKSLDLNNFLNEQNNQNSLDKLKFINKNDNNDILKLINVTHLLEYQSQSNSRSSSLKNSSKLSYFKPNCYFDNRINSNSNNLLRGGNVDALIILATSSACFIAPNHKVNKIKKCNINSRIATNNTTINVESNTNIKNINSRSNFMFQEAFLTTYRAFIQPIDLINKLIYRYRLFSNKKLIKLNNITDFIDPLNEFKAKNYDFENNARFDLSRLNLILKKNRIAKLISINCLTFLIRVVDEIRYEINILVMILINLFIKIKIN